MKKKTRSKKSAVNIIKQRIKNPEKTMEKIEKAEKQLKSSGQKSVSLTDPDARWMMNKIEFSYNSQISVDHKSGIILSNSVTQDPTDHNQLIPTIEKIIETIGPLPKDTSLSADNGYYTLENLYISTKIISMHIYLTENKPQKQKQIINIQIIFLNIISNMITKTTCIYVQIIKNYLIKRHMNIMVK
jgi:transposase